MLWSSSQAADESVASMKLPTCMDCKVINTRSHTSIHRETFHEQTEISLFIFCTPTTHEYCSVGFCKSRIRGGFEYAVGRATASDLGFHPRPRGTDRRRDH